MEARTNSSIPAWWSPSNPTFDQPQVNLAAPLKQRFGVRAILQTSSEFLTSTCRGDVLPRFSSNLELEATRCPKGQRLRSKAPFGHWKTQTFIAGLRCFGLTAPFVVDRPMTGAVKVMVATKPVDFRKGAEGLAALVRETMGADPFSGAVYVFRAKRTDRIKLIFWDGTGVCLYAKRLEDGEFRWPKVQDGVMRLTAAQLSALLEGLDWRRVHETRQTSVPAQAG